MNPSIHSLLSGATVISLSPHGFKFSDGTESEAQLPEVVAAFTLQRKYESRGEIHGMAVNQMSMLLSEEQLTELKSLSEKADLVIVPFPVLTALREQGVREQFGNCVAFNATPETQRAAPQDKIVDINNWSY